MVAAKIAEFLLCSFDCFQYCKYRFLFYFIFFSIIFLLDITYLLVSFWLLYRCTLSIKEYIGIYICMFNIINVWSNQCKMSALDLIIISFIGVWPNQLQTGVYGLKVHPSPHVALYHVLWTNKEQCSCSCACSCCSVSDIM